MCITPITLKREYKNMANDFTKVVPCGKCVKCLRRRQSAWAFRLSEEQKVSRSSCFLTLTYENPPVSPLGYHTLDKTDLQKFFKRLRKSLNHAGIKYYACGEYGPRTLRPHYHIIMFNLPQSYLQTKAKLTDVWGHGIIDIGDCSLASIRYTTKYVMKGGFQPEDYVDITTGKIFEDDRNPEFSIMSKKMGISHIQDKNGNDTQVARRYKNRLIDSATLPGGELVPLPRYFKEKLFTKEERKLLAEQHALQREMDWEKIYRNAEHELEWKKQLILQTERLQLTERNAL